MPTFKRIALLLTVGLVTTTGAFLTWVLLNWDRRYDAVPRPMLPVSADPGVIAKGRYLVRGPAHCSNCHVGDLQEMARADGGEELPMRGGLEFPVGPIAVLYPANLTPDAETGIGGYADGDLFRMLRHNVKSDGRPSIAPLMPFAQMADDDLVAIVSYLRASEPARHDVPPARWTLLGKVVAATLRPAVFAPVTGHSPPASAPPQAPTVERGSYLANSVANCMGCHSPLDRTTGALTGPVFSGNALGEVSMIDPSLLLRAPNLTPDPTGVLARFADEEAWVGRFRTGRVIAASYMPWGPFSRMTDEDLRAIYRYLRTLAPVANDVGPIEERTGG